MKAWYAAILVFILQPTLWSQTKPNILLIVGDDMGYADVGFHGCKDIPTPHLDALAQSGVKCTNGYVSGPYCSPTRAALLTGRYQQRFGHEFNPTGKHGMPNSEVTLANRLKAAGYATGLVGKWHLGSEEAMQPQSRGFEHFYGFLGGAHSYFDAKGIRRGTTPIKEMEYTTDDFGREAVAFIDQNKTRPWFLYLAFNAVHTPMHATDSRLAKFSHIKDEQRRTYNAMMLGIDDAVGRVRNHLHENGLDNNTLVMFISDNGGPTMKGVTVNGSLNTPLRGSKRTTLEGGIRVPFLVSWPAQLKPAVYEQPVIQIDLTATSYAAAGLSASPDWKLEGVNLLPYLRWEIQSPPHKALFWRFGDQMAIRQGDYKLVRYDSNVDTQSGKKEPVTTPRLYNLKEDIQETMDLSSQLPDKVRQLQASWDEWNKSNVKPRW